MKYNLFLFVRFLALEALVVLTVTILCVKFGLPLITALSLVFCSAFFLGRLDRHFFPPVNKREY